jgi:hypothetical protein
VHGIRAQEGQDTQKEKPAMPAETRPDVLEQLADGAPHQDSMEE